MGRTFADPENPLLVSCRSGAPVSMPRMLETVLNVGLTRETLPGLARQMQNERFAWDCYCRLIRDYAETVLAPARGVEPGGEHGIRNALEQVEEQYRQSKNRKENEELDPAELAELAELLKAAIPIRSVSSHRSVSTT